MADYITVEKISELENSEYPIGTVAKIEQDNQVVVLGKEGWEPVQGSISGDGLQLNIYDLNKQIISQFPSLSEEKLEESKTMLNNWGKSFNYSLLYGQEISYFTLFKKEDILESDFENYGEAIISLLHDITDTIYIIDLLENNAVEIWIKYQDTTTVLYLFDYTNGLVTFNGK